MSKAKKLARSILRLSLTCKRRHKPIESNWTYQILWHSDFSDFALLGFENFCSLKKSLLCLTRFEVSKIGQNYGRVVEEEPAASSLTSVLFSRLSQSVLLLADLLARRLVARSQERVRSTREGKLEGNHAKE